MHHHTMNSNVLDARVDVDVDVDVDVVDVLGV
jgi:hypothetical protein